MLRSCDIRGTKVRVHCIDPDEELVAASDPARPHPDSLPISHLDFRYQLQYKFRYGLNTPIVLLEDQVFVLSLRIALSDLLQHGIRRLHLRLPPGL